MKSFSYRGNFWWRMSLTTAESITILLAINIIFGHIGTISGWDYHNMLVLIGTFMIADTFAWFFYKGGLHVFDELINKGTLDWLLVKPVDAQFLAATHRIDVDDAGRTLVGVGLLAYGLQYVPLVQTLAMLPVYIFLILCGQVVLYSIMIIVKTISFKSIHGWATNAVSFRFQELARYPTDIYTGMLHTLYTFILPLAFIATVPAKALTGKLSLPLIVGAIFAATISLAIARLVWLKALKGYSSASS